MSLDSSPAYLGLAAVAMLSSGCCDCECYDELFDSQVQDTVLALDTEDSYFDTDSPDDSSLDTGDTEADADTDADSDTDTDIADDGWPDPFAAAYFDATAYPTLKIGEIPVENDMYHYVAGFVVNGSVSSCDATWGTYYSIEDGPSAWEDGSEYTLYDQLELLRGQGGDIMVSFGGAANTPLASDCLSADDLFEQYYRVVDELDVTRIDFDIEGYWLADRAANDLRSEAIVQLQEARFVEGEPLHVWYTLPVLPSGLTYDGLNILQDAVDDGVDIAGVNIMTMNYGDWEAPNPDGQMGEYGIQAMTSLKEQLADIYGASKTEEELWAMVGSTPMIGLNDVTTEIFYLEDMEETVDFALDAGVGMLSAWSANRDHPCDSSWVQIHCHSLPHVLDWAFLQEASEFGGY
jgi:hypothetical protein